MRTGRILALGCCGSLSVAALVNQACGTDEGSEFGAGGNDGGHFADGNGGGFNNDDSGMGGGNQDGAACKTSESQAELQPLYLGFVFDVSGSMGQLDCPFWNNDPYTKWRPVAEAVESFFDNPGSTKINASLTLFPAASDKCVEGTYQTPDVAMNALPSPLFTQRLKQYETSSGLPTDGGLYPDPMPVGGSAGWLGSTPTLYAIKGVLTYIRPIKAAHPEARTALVLVTDGHPQGCTDNDPNHVKDVIVGAHGENIFTYVIGVKDPPLPGAGATPPWAPDGVHRKWACPTGTDSYRGGWPDGSAPYVPPATLGDLNAWAQAGNGHDAVLLDTGNPAATKAALLTAINNIRAAQISCELTRPPPPSGQTFDPDKVNVRYDSSGTSTPLSFDAECKGDRAWRYKGTGTDVIELCPSTCNTVRADSKATVQVEFGCIRRNVIR